GLMKVVLGLMIAMFAVSAYGASETDEMLAQLEKIRLDKKQIHSIRDVTIRRDVFAISFTRGTIAFLEPVAGRITGAIFVGSGDVVAIPSNTVEKQQLLRFSDSALLTEHFDSAIFRFTDDTGQEILKGLADHAQEDPSTEDIDAVQMLE